MYFLFCISPLKKGTFVSELRGDPVKFNPLNPITIMYKYGEIQPMDP